jgi:hypothetical protein
LPASAEWDGRAVRQALADPHRGEPETSAVLYIRSASTGSFPILLSADDGNRYWAKWPGNPHGNKSLVNEWVVLKLGEEIGAPVRPGALVQVEQEFIGDLRFNGVAPSPGTFFGSRFQAGSEEQTQIGFVGKDGNAERFARFLALWELCMGDDAQFLYSHTDDLQVWSIDHGLWFNCMEGDWTPAQLAAWTEESWEWPEGRFPAGLSARELHEAANSLDRLTSGAIGRAVGGVPVDWEVPDDELYALAYFIHCRRGAVASRLRAAATHY